MTEYATAGELVINWHQRTGEKRPPLPEFLQQMGVEVPRRTVRLVVEQLTDVGFIVDWQTEETTDGVQRRDFHHVVIGEGEALVGSRYR